MPGGFGVMVRYTGLGSGFFGGFLELFPKTPFFGVFWGFWFWPGPVGGFWGFLVF